MRKSSMEDDLWRKTTIDGRQPLMEDTFLLKTTFKGRLCSTKYRCKALQGTLPQQVTLDYIFKFEIM